MDQYLPIVLLLVVALGFAAGSFVASRLLAPQRPTAVKRGPYESGIVPRQPPSTRFAVRFYLVSMIFIIFDIEVVFLYPWATIFGALRLFGLAEMATFVLVVFVSFAYLVSNGALDWGPPKRLGRRVAIDTTRTTMATVKRVPRPEQVPINPAPVPVEDGDEGNGGTPGAGGGGQAVAEAAGAGAGPGEGGR
jgi:NADH-quinone oxidoreductase subunit A